MTERTDKTENTESGLTISTGTGHEYWEVPHSVDTRYGPHGYFRYIGKFPPQIARYLISEYSSPRDTILDPMCGGGTVLAEAAMAGRRAAIGYDVNPAALIIARAASAPLEPKDLRCEAKELLGKYDELCLGQEGLFRSRQSSSFKLIDLGDSSKFFTPEAHGHLSVLFRCISEIPNAAHQDFFLTCFFSVLRRASLCNVKKMNIEVDRNKKKVWPVNEIFPKAVNKNLLLNDDFYRSLPRLKTTVLLRQQNAMEFCPDDKDVGLLIVHPPYMSNTAFSESTQLQLAYLGIAHKKIWKQELRHRGSYLHETNGVRKYLVGWCKIIRQAYDALKRGGYLAAVVGDGQVDTVRIPVAVITREFCEDAGFEVVRCADHVLNNNTGRTLNRRMRTQGIIIARKP